MMTIGKAPVIRSLRPFDPTAYSGVAKAAKTGDTEPILKLPAMADGESPVKTRVADSSDREAEICPKHLKPPVTAEPARVAILAASTESNAVETSAMGVNGSTEFPTLNEHGTLRLVSLRVIKKVYNLEVDGRRHSFAEVDGWTCKIPARQYREGELILFFQVDSFLPGADNRFGKPKKLRMVDGKLGQRLKTETFGKGEDKIVSQGMILPVQGFREIWMEVEVVRQFISTGLMKNNVALINKILLAMYRDKNWADVLRVKKWEGGEAQAQLEQPDDQRLGPYPGELFRRTGVNRAEDCPNLFTKHKYNTLVYQESVKMDGASMVVYFVNKTCARYGSLNPLPAKVGPNTVLENGRFGVCSNKVDKNELAPISPGDFRYWETALRYGLPAKLSKLGRNVAIQGELCGDRIQSNREGIPDGEQDFFVFAMTDIEKGEFLNPKEVETMAKELGLKHVPVLGYVKITDIAASYKDLKKRAAQRKGEGLVFKCLADGRRFKVISSTYLLEHGI